MAEGSAGNTPNRRPLSWRPGLVLADLIGVNAAFAAAYWLRYKAQIGGPIEWYNDVPYREYVPWGLSLSLILVVLFWLEGLYSRQRKQAWVSQVYSLATGTLVGIGLLALLVFGLRPPAQSRLMLLYAAVLTVVLLSLVRAIDRAVRLRRLRRGHGVQRTVIVGAGEMGRTVMRNIVAEPGLGYRVIGFLDDNPSKRSQSIGRFEPLGGTSDLPAVLRDQSVDVVIVALPWRSRETIVRLVDQGDAAGVQVRIVPDLFQMSLNRVDLDSLHGVPLIAVQAPVIRGWHYRAKRALDITISAAGLTLAAPLAAVIAVAIKLESPGPVHFRQDRVGRDGRVFTCLKFRSMVDGASGARAELEDRNEASGPLFKIREDPRQTHVGRVLRRFSLDELPQLWNVLRGDMSLVGPRPPMPSEVDAYDEWHHRRLEVSPGMTGLWQVSGRSNLTFDEMVMLDLFYAENWSLGLDVQILLRTLPSVLWGTGAY